MEMRRKRSIKEQTHGVVVDIYQEIEDEGGHVLSGDKSPALSLEVLVVPFFFHFSLYLSLVGFYYYFNFLINSF